MSSKILNHHFHLSEKNYAKLNKSYILFLKGHRKSPLYSQARNESKNLYSHVLNTSVSRSYFQSVMRRESLVLNSFSPFHCRTVGNQNFSTHSFKRNAKRVKKIIAPGSLPRNSNKIVTVHTKHSEKFKEETEANLYAKNFMSLKRLHEIKSDHIEDMNFLFSHCDFLKSYASASQLPASTDDLEINQQLLVSNACSASKVTELRNLSRSTPMKEIAFIGRSNVGKSSIISALLKHPKNLVRISKTPGRTQLLNYFRVGLPLSDIVDLNQNGDVSSSLFYIVDMPGYGFAKAPVAVVNDWNQLVKGYFEARSKSGSPLAMVYLLLDAKLNHMKELDKEYIRMFYEKNIPFTILLTKIDKTDKDTVAYFIASIHKTLLEEFGIPKESLPLIIPTSAVQNKNVDLLRMSVYQNCFLHDKIPQEYFLTPVPIIYHHDVSKAKAKDAEESGKKVIKILRGERPLGRGSSLSKLPFVSAPKHIDRVNTRPAEEQRNYIRIMRHHNVFQRKKKSLKKREKFIY